jgi:hypothetical protein
MRRGFVGGGITIAGVMALAALVAMVLGQEWALWPFIPLLIIEIVFVVAIIRRRRTSSGRSGRWMIGYWDDGQAGWFDGAMTKQGADRGNTGSVLALTVLTVVLWVVALAMGVTVLVLLLRIGAPVNRTSVIVAGWFLTPAVWAVGATVWLVVVRRASRSRSDQADSPSSGPEAPS